MSTFNVNIERVPATAGAPVAYYVHVDVDSGLAGVTTAAATPCANPDLAMRDARQKLANLTAADEIRYRNVGYATLDEVMLAIDADRPNWS